MARGIRQPGAPVLGVFAKTFARASFHAVLDAIVAHDLDCIHFNFSCAGLPSLPDSIAPGLLDQLREESRRRRVAIAGVSATFNMIHPDPRQREEGLRKLAVIAAAAPALDCRLVTLCTGTRDPHDMWRAHAANDSPAAWRDLCASMTEAIGVAEQHDVLLGIEPETANVVNSARKARQLLDEMKSSRVKIVIDPANLFSHGELAGDAATGDAAGPQRIRDRVRERIDEAFQFLHADMATAHAKELARDGSMGSLPPGQGVIDWDFYIERLRRSGFTGALMMHGLPESSVAGAIAFLRARLEAPAASPPFATINRNCDADIRSPE